MVCAFFGHRDAPHDIAPRLRNTLTHLIAIRGITTFYVGYHGNFDRMVIRTLSELKNKFPHIRITVLLSHMPTNEETFPAGVETEFPVEAATAPSRFAIDRVNHWMVNHGDVFVTYIQHAGGGAAKFARAASRANKEMINLGE